MSTDKEFDIAVFGATGFTGALITEYLMGKYGDSLKVAVAGRNEVKLKNVTQELQITDRVSTVVVDAADEAGLCELAKRCRVIISAAGPYTLHGKPLVAACASVGTDYVDLTGESNFIREMIDTYSDKARESGARIVHSCGFDSVPTDLGIYRLQQLAREYLGSPFQRVKGRVEALQGAASGGTVASIMAAGQAAQENQDIADQMVNPYSLAEGFEGPTQPSGNEAVNDEELGSWSAPFIMAEINTKNVHRTNMLLGHSYGVEFLYDEMMFTGPGAEGEGIANAVEADPIGAFTGGGEPPKPGEGPSKEERENGHFTIAYHGTTNGKSIAVRVAGFQDPGYGSTSKQIAESAMCLLLDGVPTKGGIWTPASCMAQQLTQRLQDQGVLSFTDELNV
ncbi:MAG: saccharopine dehydrogenase NADP-binding domain-containing protein [Pseudomonadota bacterium]